MADASLVACEVAPAPFDACAAFAGLAWARDAASGEHYTPVKGVRLLLGVSAQALTQWTTPRSVSDLHERAVRTVRRADVPSHHPSWSLYAGARRLALLSTAQVLAYVRHVYRLGEHTVEAEVWEDVVRLRGDGDQSEDPRRKRALGAEDRKEVEAAMDGIHRARRQSALPAWSVDDKGGVSVAGGIAWPKAWFVSAWLAPLCARLGYALVPVRAPVPEVVHRPTVVHKRRRVVA